MRSGLSNFLSPGCHFLETFESMSTVEPYTKFQRVLHADHLFHNPLLILSCFSFQINLKIKD